MVNYENGKIYGIYDESGNCIYVGSTCQMVCQRASGHRKDSRHKPDLFIYKYIADNGGWDFFTFSLIEKYPCENREELHRKEGEYIRLLNPVANRRIAGRSYKEWYTDTIDERNIYHREWRAVNLDRDKRNAYERAYRSKNREAYNLYQREWKARKMAVEESIF